MTRPRAASGPPSGLALPSGRRTKGRGSRSDGPRRLVTPRDRYDLGDARQIVMEGRIEARHLRQLGIETPERLDRLDLAGKVVGVIGDDPAQLR